MALRWGIVSAGLIANDFTTMLSLLPPSEHQVHLPWETLGLGEEGALGLRVPSLRNKGVLSLQEETPGLRREGDPLLVPIATRALFSACSSSSPAFVNLRCLGFAGGGSLLAVG